MRIVEQSFELQEKATSINIPSEPLLPVASTSENLPFKLFQQVFVERGASRGIFGFVVDIRPTTVTVSPSRLCTSASRKQVKFHDPSYV